MKVLRASTSLPFISKKVHIKKDYYWDGGITDPIPLMKALQDGCDKSKCPLHVGRTEKDFSKINPAFALGYKVAKEHDSKVISFLCS